MFGNTLAELRNQTAIHELHRGADDEKEGYYQKSQDIYAPVLDSIEQTDKDSSGSLLGPTLRKLSPEDTQQKLQGHHGDLQPVQDGWVTKTEAFEEARAKDVDSGQRVTTSDTCWNSGEGRTRPFTRKWMAYSMHFKTTQTATSSMRHGRRDRAINH